MDTTTQLKDHEKRLRPLEAFMNGEKERHDGISRTFERIESDLKNAVQAFQNSSDKLIEAVEKRFASKTDLQLLKQGLENDLKMQASEGKWKARFIAVASSVMTFVIVGLIGLLLPQA